jgi:hypothetical protein
LHASSQKTYVVPSKKVESYPRYNIYNTYNGSLKEAPKSPRRLHLDKKEPKNPVNSPPPKSSFQLEVARSPGMVTPSSSPSKVRYVKKRRTSIGTSGELGAEDLIDMLSD